VSTGTFVILGVIPAITRGSLGSTLRKLEWAKTPPVGDDKYDFKKGVKGSIGCCCR